MLPNILTKTINDDVKIVRSDLYHNLKPIYRLQLYDIINHFDMPYNYQIQVNLNILTTQIVLSVWKQSLLLAEIIPKLDTGKNETPRRNSINGLFQIPDVYQVSVEEFPNYLVETAKKVLVGDISVEKAKREAREAEEVLGRTLGYPDDEFPITALYVGRAALETLQSATGKKPFNQFRVDQRLNDSTLAGRGDAASGAVMAYVANLGYIYNKNFLLEKRKEFWEWWLTDAIPQAWELAQADYHGNNP